jgi:hypothetical protein
MTLDFNIEFSEQETIQFFDESDYSGQTPTRTTLGIVWTPITDVDEVVIQLYDDNIATLGDNFDIVIATEELDTLIDGVYKFTLRVYDGGAGDNLLGSKVKYFVNSWDFRTDCRKRNVQNLIDQKCKDFSKIAELNVILDTAIWAAELDNWQEALRMIDFLTAECEGLNCGCK